MINWVKVATAYLKNKKLREKYGVQDATYFGRKERDQKITTINVMHQDSGKAKSKQKQCSDGCADQRRKGELRPKKSPRKSGGCTPRRKRVNDG